MSPPSVSVVVSTRDRPDRLRQLVAALSEQDLEPEVFEVIIVDNGSDPPVEASPGPAATGIDLRLIRNPDPGPAARGRNVGWRAARGRIVAFTDDDCRPSPGWLTALLRAAQGRDDLVVQGRTVPDPMHQEADPLAHTHSINGVDELFETCNITYPKALLERLGGFDESFELVGEDVDLGWRAKQTGAAVEFAPEAIVYHAVTTPSLSDSLRRTFQWTDGARVLKAHPKARKLLMAGLFWRSTHPRFLLLVSGLALAVRLRRPAIILLAALPYALHYRRRYGGRTSAAALARVLPRHFVQDGCEVGTMIVGSVKHRTVVL